MFETDDLKSLLYKNFIKDGITSDIKNTLINIKPNNDFIPLKLKKKLHEQIEEVNLDITILTIGGCQIIILHVLM